ncbi:MAG: GatB/YqeY domain-containing protein [Rhodospirillaceae bacterium]|jgi:uncharacterized protein|nr:GatB/YqeY domain-containing protein [Rhodospirillaceae bacterium]MBT5374705.1 GatB/YqeY domain-containing protein [Rhodospirillaceae bacterium]MBT5752606.1 GatB/YqeY domain-containing protein [Rhodospirillaceae bacterium]
MLRTRLSDELKVAMKAKDSCRTSTLRLILAALKDRDIAARGKGNADGIEEDEILSMLQTMVKQRKESITMYEKGGREELAAREAEEIKVIQDFLPSQLSEEETAAAVGEIITETDAASLKDMGRTMAELRSRYAGRMDFSVASDIVKAQLSG